MLLSASPGVPLGCRGAPLGHLPAPFGSLRGILGGLCDRPGPKVGKRGRAIRVLGGLWGGSGGHFEGLWESLLWVFSHVFVRTFSFSFVCNISDVFCRFDDIGDDVFRYVFSVFSVP